MGSTKFGKILSVGAVIGILVSALAAVNYFAPDRVEQRQQDAEMERARLEKQQEEEERRRRIYEAYKDKIVAQEAFFRKNAEREEIVSLANGLQYEVLEEGSGASPELTDRVVVHYRGTLLDGTPFDESYSRGEPLRTAVSGVIPGWQEIIQHMNEGAVYKVYIPYQLAYGEQGSPPLVPPYSALIFEIELLEVVPRPSAANGNPQLQVPD